MTLANTFQCNVSLNGETYGCIPRLEITKASVFDIPANIETWILWNVDFFYTRIVVSAPNWISWIIDRHGNDHTQLWSAAYALLSAECFVGIVIDILRFLFSHSRNVLALIDMYKTAHLLCDFVSISVVAWLYRYNSRHIHSLCIRLVTCVTYHTDNNSSRICVYIKKNDLSFANF